MAVFDDFLSGFIVFLLIMVAYKWHRNRSDCSGASLRLSCGCKKGKCHCKGMSKIRVPRGCRGVCKCGCPPDDCRCSSSCGCNREGFAQTGPNPKNVPSSGPQPATASQATQDYSAVIQDMSLEAGVADSHRSYCDSLAFAGLPTGASACTTLEETGRSYGTADFVGLTARKFCKARQIATPADDARVTPSQHITEWCDIAMDELV